MVGDEDPRAPYKVYDGDKQRGTYKTRAEARRRQQELEREESSRPEAMQQQQQIQPKDDKKE